MLLNDPFKLVALRARHRDGVFGTLHCPVAEANVPVGPGSPIYSRIVNGTNYIFIYYDVHRVARDSDNSFIYDIL